jgi:hypothetical protein
MGEDGHGGRIMVSNGIPEGPVVRGGWGSLWGWSKETMSYSVCLRPERPPQRNTVREVAPPAPDPDAPCGHPVSLRYRNSQGWQVCRQCARDSAKRSRERQKAA